MAAWTSTPPPRSRMLLAATCVFLVLAATAVRTWVAAAGWFYWDDLLLHGLAARHEYPGAELLLTDHDGHLMPGGMLLAWIAAHTAPLDFRMPLLQIAVLQLLAGAALARMLWVILSRRAVLLAPLAAALVLPLGLPTATWWSSALITLPLVTAMAWATAATLSYALNSRRRDAVSAVAATAFGLFFVEKAVVVPVVALLVLAGSYWALIWLSTNGDGTLPREFRRHLRLVGAQILPLVIAQTVVVAVWAAVFAYAVGRAGGGDEPSDSDGTGPAVADLVDQTYRLAVGPTLAGGPWRWERWHPGPPMADPTAWAVATGTLVAVAVIAWSLVTRERTGPIWAVAAMYPVVSALLVAVGRTGPDTATEIVLTLRYHADTVVVLAAAGALALAAGPRRQGDVRWERRAAAVFVVLLTSSSSLSTLTYRQTWAEQPSRDYLEPLVAALRERGEPMLDVAVPPEVLLPVTAPDNRLSAVLAGVEGIPPIGAWTTEPVVVDAAGTPRPADVVPGRHIPQGPAPDCGHRIGPGGARIELDGPLVGRDWVVRLNVLADADGDVGVRLDDDEVRAPVTAGLGTVYIRVEGGGTGLTVTPRGGVSDLCVGRGPVGVLVPR